MKGKRTPIVVSIVTLLLLIVASIVATLKIDLSQPEDGKGSPMRTRNFGEGIKLTQHGLYGVDLVSIGRAHMRKLRKGPFRIGALNELVLEDVALALPEALWNDGDAGKGTSSGNGAGEEANEPRSLLTKLGVNVNNLKLGGKMPRFSALTIKRIKVSKIVDGTNVVPWFAANSAKAERTGFVLHNGWSLDNGMTNSWKDAALLITPKLMLIH